MMLLYLSIKNFAKLCRNNKLFFVLSFFCLVCAFVSFLILQEKGYHSYLVTAEQMVETQLFYVSASDGELVKKVYGEIALSSELPSIGIATMSNKECSGVYWNRSYDDDVWYVPYGRFFTDEEMLSGESVALVSMYYLLQQNEAEADHIWDAGIVLDGNSISVIGNYNRWQGVPEDEYDYQTEILPSVLAIPLNTYLKYNISADYLRIVFSRSLTEHEISVLRKLLEPYQDDICSLILPKLSHTQALHNYYTTTRQYILILVLSLISIVSIILYWIKEEYKRYRVYMICGAKPTHVVCLLIMTTGQLVMTTYFVAFVFTLSVSALVDDYLAILPWIKYLEYMVSALSFLIPAVAIRSMQNLLAMRN